MFFKFALIFLILSLIFLRFVTYRDDNYIFVKNKNIQFEATIKKEVRAYENTQLIRIGNLKIYTDLYPRYEQGDRILVSGYVDEEGRVYRADIAKVSVVSGQNNIIGGIRAQITSGIKSTLPSREATLVLGTVLGTDEIPQSLREQLVNTGTIHVVVVSGQNLVILSSLIMALSKYIGRRKSLFISTMAILLYAMLAGFEPPVLRATIVVIYTTVASFFGRQINPILALLFAALTIVFVWPYSLFEISFQLTFAASFGIITLGKILSRWFLKIPFVGEASAISIAAYAFTVPIILYHFGKITLIAPIANVFVAEAILPVMILGFFLSIASLIFLPLAQVFAYFAYVPSFYFWEVVKFADNIPIGKISIDSQNTNVVIVLYSALAILLFLITRYDKKL